MAVATPREAPFSPGSAALMTGLRARLIDAGRTWAAGQRRLVRLAVALDRSGEWALDGARTCAHWIAEALDVEVCTAREWVRIGRALELLPCVDEAFAEGRVSYTKVRQLTRVGTSEHEAELVAIAERTPAGKLAIALASWLVRHEEPHETEARQHRARRLTWRTEPDGMIAGWFRLPPWMAATLILAIDSWILRRPATATLRGPHASADASIPPSVIWPSIPQQRADALIGLVDAGGSEVTTEIVLHVRADGCSLDDGTPIPGSLVERLAPESFLRALIHDAQSRPVNASGRQRHPSTRQKRVVHERDPACVDCGSTELLEYDHHPSFATTHRTVVDELEPRCWRCHHARHRSGAHEEPTESDPSGRP